MESFIYQLNCWCLHTPTIEHGPNGSLFHKINTRIKISRVLKSKLQLFCSLATADQNMKNGLVPGDYKVIAGRNGASLEHSHIGEGVGSIVASPQFLLSAS